LDHGNVRQAEQSDFVIRFFRQRLLIQLLGIVDAPGRQVKRRQIAARRGEIRVCRERGAKRGFRPRHVLLRGFDHPRQGLVERIVGVALDQCCGNLGGLVELAGTQSRQYQGWAGHRRTGLGVEYPFEFRQAFFALSGNDLRDRHARLDRRVVGVDRRRLVKLLKRQFGLAAGHIGVTEQGQGLRVGSRLGGDRL
jgi:hypothetical protein